MKDRHVLVLGSDYAFVCHEAVHQRAARVVLLTEAKNGASPEMEGVETLSGDLTVLEDATFDVVFFPQAHERKDLGEVLTRLKALLRPKGVLVLEVACNTTGAAIQWAVIGDGPSRRRYPSARLLEMVLLKDFAIRRVGQGVLRNDDNVAQTIFHCSLLQGTALLISGRSGRGKSNLLRLFKSEDLPTVSTDTILWQLYMTEGAPERSLSARIQAEIGDGPTFWGRVGQMIVADPELTEAFCHLLLETCPLEARAFVLEGEILRHEVLAQRLTALLDAHNVRVWAVTPRAVHSA
ncbi:MAG: hypothetical protein EA386_01930 [Rhodobacteraceae bacterium]|nr:MAG: hypothetical protein EA386_01930 [Paracoccaceae bacterium]